MKSDIARRSQEHSVSHESESFQDLNCNYSGKSQDNDRFSANSLVSSDSNQRQKATQTVNLENGNHKYHEEVIAYLKRQNQKLKKQNVLLNQKFDLCSNEKMKLQILLTNAENQSYKNAQQLKILSFKNKQLKLALKDEKQAFQKVSKALHSNFIDEEKVNSLQNKIQSLEQAVCYFQKSERQMIAFLRKQQMQFNQTKPTKSIIEGIFSQISLNRVELASQIGGLMEIIGQKKKQSQEQKYNHWKQMRRIEEIGQFMIKCKNQITSQKLIIQGLNTRISNAQQTIRDSQKVVSVKKKESNI